MTRFLHQEVSLEMLGFCFLKFAPSRSCAVIVTVACNLFLKNQFLSVSDYIDCYPELKPLTQKGTTDVFDTLAISDPKVPKYRKCPSFRNIRLGLLRCPLGQDITGV